MKRSDKDKYLGEATKAAPTKGDSDVDANSLALQRSSPSTQALQDQAVHMALITINRIVVVQREQASRLNGAIEKARDLGATWQEVGDALDVSAQAAWEKYRPRAASSGKGVRPPQAEELPFN